MSKTTSPSYPSYYNGQVNINGENKASSFLNGNTVTSNYNMTDSEKDLYDYAQNNLVSAVKNINTFLPETWDNINSQVKSYTNQGISTINDVYTPMISNLKNDIASRFGNFDNSVFMDNLNSIEDKRADSIAALAEDVNSQKSSLINDELSNRYSYINLLNTMQNQPLANALNLISVSNSNSSAGNSYAQALYNAMNNNSTSTNNFYSNLYSNLASLGLTYTL